VKGGFSVATDPSVLADARSWLHRAFTTPLLVALAGALAFAACLRQISDPDYWTHLALARAYLTNGSLWIGEPFIALAAGDASPAAPPELALPGFALPESWPFQMLLYTVRAAGGDAAVSVVVAVLAATIVMLVMAAVRPRIGVPRRGLSLLLVFGILWVARFRFVVRPELGSYVALAAALLCVQRWVARPDPAPLAALAAIVAVWTQLHVSWALGVAFVILHLALLPDRNFWRARLASSPRLALAAGGVAVVFAIAGAARFAARVARLFLDGQVSTVLEMEPAWRFPEAFLPFVVVAALGVLLAWGDREGRLRRLALLMASVSIGSIVVRNLAFAALCLAPAAFAGLERWPMPRVTHGARLLPPLAVAAGIALVAQAIRDPSGEWGVGIVPGSVPRDAAEFVVRAGLPEPVFNSFDFGGYLDFAWAGRPHTFLDGRLSPPSRVADHAALTRLRDPEGVIGKYGFRTIVLKPLYDHYGSIVPVVPWLLENPEWSLVRTNDALVFVRGPLPARVRALPAAAAWRHVLQRAHGSHGPYTEAIALLQLGDERAAARAFNDGVRRNPAVAGQYATLGEYLGVR